MGSFANRTWVKVLAWITAAIIVSLNIKLVIDTIGEWINAAGSSAPLVTCIVVPVAIALLILLLWVSFAPLLPAMLRRGAPVAPYPSDVAANLKAPAYSKILVSLDHTDRDRAAIAHAAAMARSYGAKLYLLHVEEGVTSQVYGSMSSTAEVEAGREYLAAIVETLKSDGLDAEAVIRHADTPKAQIIRAARQIEPDLLIMASHGHKGLKDLIFGATINAVRHALEIPLLVVRDPDRKR
jgi:manganese transport protein